MLTILGLNDLLIIAIISLSFIFLDISIKSIAKFYLKKIRFKETKIKV